MDKANKIQIAVNHDVTGHHENISDLHHTEEIELQEAHKHNFKKVKSFNMGGKEYNEFHPEDHDFEH